MSTPDDLRQSPEFKAFEATAQQVLDTHGREVRSSSDKVIRLLFIVCCLLAALSIVQFVWLLGVR